MRFFSLRLVQSLVVFALLTGRPIALQAQYLPLERLANGEQTRALFQDAAAPASRWTVEVRRGIPTIALGIVVDSEGLVLTKLSEIESGDDAEPLVCRFGDRRGYVALIAARDRENDLALLRINAKDLPTVAWSRQPHLDLGRWAISATARGEPLSVGVISARRRSVPAVRVQGILGVQIGDDGPATVQRVFERSPADSAGIAPGDIIERLQDTEVSSGRAFIRIVRRHQPGDRLVLHIKRGEESKSIEVTLTHPFGDFLSQFAQQTRMGSTLSNRRDGFEDAFSHDAAILPADCGGPVLDLSGAVIGVNIARAGRTETLVLPREVVQQSIKKMRGDMATESDKP